MGHHFFKGAELSVIHLYGEVSERFMELVLKTSDPERDRGFESHPLRHNSIGMAGFRPEKYSSG